MSTDDTQDERISEIRANLARPWHEVESAVTTARELLAHIDAQTARIEALEGALRAEVEWYESMDGPLFEDYEQGIICNYDDTAVDWPQALNMCGDDFYAVADLETDIVRSRVVRYRMLRAALAEAQEGA